MLWAGSPDKLHRIIQYCVFTYFTLNKNNKEDDEKNSSLIYDTDNTDDMDNDKKSYVFDNENSIEWDTYRRSAITDLIKETKQMLLDVRPGCKLSAAVKPNLLMARNRYFQEWDVWLAAGYLDWVMPMNYTPDIRKFAENIDIIYVLQWGLRTYMHNILNIDKKCICRNGRKSQCAYCCSS